MGWHDARLLLAGAGSGETSLAQDGHLDWGVSVLEMFTGEVAWMSGEAAAGALEGYLRAVERDPALPAMPKPLAELLRRCFRQDPAERWATMLEVAEALRRIYRECVGREYPRPTPAFPRASDRKFIEHDRRTTTGAHWDDPRGWLVRALKADGRDPAEADTLLLERKGSRQAQAVADLAAYDEAQHIYERLIAAGRKDLEAPLARLYMHQALVHEHLNDASGTLDLYDRAIAIRERLVQQEGRKELRGDLAWVQVSRARALLNLGERARASTEARQAVAVLEEEVRRTHRSDLQDVLS